MPRFSRFVRVSLPRPDSVTEGQYQDYVQRLMDALEAMGFTNVHVGASLRDRTVELAMDGIEARTVDEAQVVFSHIVQRAVSQARVAFMEPDSQGLRAVP